MKNIIILLLTMAHTTLCAQNHLYRNVPNNYADPKTAENIEKVDKIAYERACNDSIYKKEVMQSFLDYYNIDVEDIRRYTTSAFYYIINSNTFRRNQPSMLPALYSIMNRVVTKGKKIKSEDKIIWKQIYYDYEYSRIMASIIEEQKTAEARNDSIEDYQKRHDWSKSELLEKLREFCSQDYSVKDSFVNKFLEKYNITFTEQFKLQNLRPSPFNENDKSWIELYNICDYVDGKLGYDRIHSKSERTYLADSTELVYNRILHECRYIPKKIESFSRFNASKGSFTETLHKYYEQDKNDTNVRELDSLLKRWKYITNENLLEKKYLSESDFKQRCIELEKAISEGANNTIKDGVLKEDGCIIPYKVDGDKFVVHGTCIFNYIDEQYPNATGAHFNSLTSNLKLVVKVENGKAISQRLTGYEKGWSENDKIIGRTYYETRRKILAAKPIVVMTNQVNHSYYKHGETMMYNYLGWDTMLRKLKYVFNHAYLDYDDFSISKLCQRYLEQPQEDTLNKIRMPFAIVDISAICEDFSW